MYCQKLYDLGGSVLNLHPSQELIYKSLKDLNLKILKNEIKDLNLTIVNTVKQNTVSFYPDIKTIDDLQYIVNWAVNLFTEYFKIFPISKFTPLAIDFEPVHNLNSCSIRLSADIVLYEEQSKPRLHIVNFYPLVDTHLKENDFLSSLKIKFFKELYKSVHPHISVRLNYLSVNPASFRNRSQKTYRFKHLFNGRIRKLDNIKLVQALNTYSNSHKKIYSIPYCPNSTCQKRKECQNG